MPSNALYRVPDTTLNALSGPPTVLGMNPLVNRLALIPRYSRQEGVVMPQWVYDMARAAQAPGNALMGHQTTPEEALNFAGNVSLGSYGTSAMMRDAAPGPGKTVGATVYHGSPHNFDAFDMAAPKTTGGSFNRYGISVTANRKVAERYASDFGGGKGHVYTVDSAVKNPLVLDPKEFHYLQTKVGKIDAGQSLSEVEQVWLEDMLNKHGIKFDATSQHPMDVIKHSGFDAIETPTGRGGAETETLVFDPSLLKIMSKE